MDMPRTKGWLLAAATLVLAGSPVAGNQVPSIGCNIKWSPGNEPEYYR